MTDLKQWTPPSSGACRHNHLRRMSHLSLDACRCSQTDHALRLVGRPSGAHRSGVPRGRHCCSVREPAALLQLAEAAAAVVEMAGSGHWKARDVGGSDRHRQALVGFPLGSLADEIGG